MQSRFNSQYQIVNDDVYADVDASVSRNTFATEGQEFSLAAIQEKLGNVTATGNDVSATPDIMPTTQTINMSYARDYAPQTGSATKMSTKTKALVISYVAVVLMLVLAVTLCGVAVGNSFADTLAVDAQYSEVASQLATLTEQAGQEDFAELVAKAASLGYVDASTSNTLSYTEVETRPAQNIAIQTNWFDSLCDWVCNLFGA